MNHSDVKKKIKEYGAEIKHSYVYLLKKDSVVVYVGQSITVEERLATHRRGGLDFDDFDLIECKKEDAGDLEAENIVCHNPKYNSNLPANSLYIHESKAGSELSKVFRESLVGVPYVYMRRGEDFRKTCISYYFDKGIIDGAKECIKGYFHNLKLHKKECK